MPIASGARQRSAVTSRFAPIIATATPITSSSTPSAVHARPSAPACPPTVAAAATPTTPPTITQVRYAVSGNATVEGGYVIPFARSGEFRLGPDATFSR